jgi:AbrB family looped-hinge helix DNA binding protein
MITTIDGSGRLVLPRAIRERAQLTPGTPLEVRVVDGHVEIEPAAAAVTIRKVGAVWVAVPTATVPTLTEAEVDATVERIRTPVADAARRRKRNA